MLGAPAMQALLLKHPLEEAASPSDREINANSENSYERSRQKPLYRTAQGRLRHSPRRREKPLAVEPTQDAAIEKARKLEPDAAIHVERVRNVEGGGRDKWRRI